MFTSDFSQITFSDLKAKPTSKIQAVTVVLNQESMWKNSKQVGPLKFIRGLV